MRAPSSVLARVRGTVAIAALAACASPPPSLEPEPPIQARAEVVDVAPAAPPDPVAYASTEEAARLSRLDAELEADESARASRTTAARRARSRLTGVGTSGLGALHPGYACGRG